MHFKFLSHKYRIVQFVIAIYINIIIEKIQFIKTIKKEINKLPNTHAICIRNGQLVRGRERVNQGNPNGPKP